MSDDNGEDFPRFALHAGGIGDKAIHDNNVQRGYELCERCDGTGNELYSMWKRCTDCGGSGRAEDVRKKA